MMKHINTTIAPNPVEYDYWVDIKENSYGGIVKYYDLDKGEWVYMDEPMFQQSPASKITERHFEVIDDVADLPEYVSSLQKQIVNLEESKADKSEIYTKEEASEVHDDLQLKIDKNTGDIITSYDKLSNKVESVNDSLQKDIDVLRNNDIELRNAISEKTSYTYVEQLLQNITGVPPTVLDTLEELAAALGDDPNFAATVAEQIGKKLDREQAIELISDVVPVWAQQSTKPIYTASEVGALPSSTFVPSKTTQLTNDAGFLTQLEVNALIQSHKPLTTALYASINKLDSYVVYNLTEGELNMPITYGTIVANITSAITTLKVKFESNPTAGNYYVLYVNPTSLVSILFCTLSGEVFHTADISDMQRFDIRIIDLTDYILSAENNDALLTGTGNTIVANYVDGYIVDYVGGLNDIEWYEG